jgi:hypothetical protein
MKKRAANLVIAFKNNCSSKPSFCWKIFLLGNILLDYPICLGKITDKREKKYYA